MAKNSLGFYWWRFGIVSVLALQLSWGLRVARLDHGDELWTLAAIQRSFGELITFILGHDNHPPLYYILVKAWSSIAGEGIGSVRIASYVFGLLALVLFALFHLRSRPIAFIAPLLVLSTNPLFIYYSATIRPYAFMVFLASCALLSSMALRNSDPSGLENFASFPRGCLFGKLCLQILFYGSCLLLGFTHYYGLLYVIILLVWDILERRISASRLPAIIVAALLLLWPAQQLVFGSLDKQLESNAWVKVVPIVSTINNFLMGLFPSITVSRNPPYIFSLGLLLCLGSILLAQQWKSQSLEWSSICSFLQGDVGYLTMGLLIVFAVSLAVDLSVPFSTPYYFLVGLPAIALLFGFWVRWMRQSFGLLPASLLMAAVALNQIMLAQQRLILP